VTDLKIDKHAVKRAIERFNVKPDDAEKWVRRTFSKAMFVTDVKNDDGRTIHLYAYREITFIYWPQTNAIKTVFPSTRRTPLIIRDKIVNLFRKELRSLERQRAALIARAERGKAEINAEIGYWQDELKRARGGRRLAIKARIEALEIALIDIEREVKEIDGNVKAVALALVSHQAV